MSERKPRMIKVDLAMQLANEGYKFIKLVPLPSQTSSCDQCAHPIANEYWFLNTKRKTYHKLGGTCQFKVYLFEKFGTKISEDRLREGSRLLDIGAILWKIDYENLKGYVERVLKNESVQINLENLPSRSDEELYWKTLKNVYKHAMNLRNKETKDANEKRQRELDKKYAADRAKQDIDFMNLARTPFKDERLEAERRELLKEYLETLVDMKERALSGWDAKERKRAIQLVKIATPSAQVQAKMEQTRAYVMLLEKILLKIAAMTNSDWVKGFSTSIADNHVISRGLSLNQRTKFLQIVNGTYASENGDVLKIIHDPSKKSIESILDDVDKYLIGK